MGKGTREYLPRGKGFQFLCALPPLLSLFPFLIPALFFLFVFLQLVEG